MAIKRVFKSRIHSCSYFFKGGKQAAFINGKYLTDIESEIAELEAEIGKEGLTVPSKSNHPHLYIDSNEKEVDTNALDPISIIKKKAVEEYLAQQAKNLDHNNDRGNSESMPATTGMVTSKGITDLAAGSASGGSGVKITPASK